MDDRKWALVCVSKKAGVSILKDLDTYTARETYRRLCPDQAPREHIFPEEYDGWEEDDALDEAEWLFRFPHFHRINFRFGQALCGYSGSYDDRIRIEVIGPEGEELDPWAGVDPIIHDYRTPRQKVGMEGKRQAEEDAKWDPSRTDFWNNPALWDGIDPRKGVCWS